MRTTRTCLRWMLPASLVLAAALLIVPATRADDDDRDSHDRRREHGEHDDKHDDSRRRGKRWVFALKHAVEPVSNAAYRKECGACHMAYQPALLPARSWAALLAGLEHHFGHDASLPEKTLLELRDYTARNAAEVSRGETAYKILRSLGGASPERISDLPYIRHEHDELAPGVLQRKSIGSMANCAACHRSAEQGLYDEDDVVVPQ